LSLLLGESRIEAARSSIAGISLNSRNRIVVIAQSTITMWTRRRPK